MYIDIHTHHPKTQRNSYFALANMIVSKDYLTYKPCSVGIHPWYIDDNVDKQFEALVLLQANEAVIAVGECGLDKMHSTPWDKQVMAFERQITLANELNKPIIVHCVRAYAEVLTSLMRMKTKVPVILHGYSKNWELAKTLLHHGYYLSLGANILKGQHLDLLQNIPLDRLFLETDDKTIAISDIYAYFCHARKLTKEQLQEQIVQNFNRVFNYSLV